MLEKTLLYEGKAKKIYQTNDEAYVQIEYKDEATAFNGEKKATVTGKGRLNNLISIEMFKLLDRNMIPTHFVKQVSPTEQLVKNVKIIPIEVVVRNVVAGSLSRRIGIDEGEPLKRPIVEFYYKNDDLGDPLITEDHIAILELANYNQISEMKGLAVKINEILQQYFESKQIQLIDFKLEFGTDALNKILLADEVSPDTCRLWDMNSGEKLDKDVFRQGMGELTDVYEKLLSRLID